MTTQNKKPSIAALSVMISAAIMFSLLCALPAVAQTPSSPHKPIGASPGSAVPVAPPKKAPKTDKTAKDKDSKADKASKKSESKTPGVGASAGGVGAGSAKTIGGVSLKTALIIGGSVVGVLALLIAGSGGGDGGSSPSHNP